MFVVFPKVETRPGARAHHGARLERVPVGASAVVHDAAVEPRFFRAVVRRDDTLPRRRRHRLLAGRPRRVQDAPQRADELALIADDGVANVELEMHLGDVHLRLPRAGQRARQTRRTLTFLRGGVHLSAKRVAFPLVDVHLRSVPKTRRLVFGDGAHQRDATVAKRVRSSTPDAPRVRVHTQLRHAIVQRAHLALILDVIVLVLVQRALHVHAVLDVFS